MQLITEPGEYPDFPVADYFAEPCPSAALTASGAMTLLGKTPLEFACQHPALLNTPTARKDEAAMRVGAVAHRLCLGRGVDYEVLEYPDWRTKGAQEARETARLAGKTPILLKEVLVARETVASFGDAIAALNLLFGDVPYVTETMMATHDGKRGHWRRSLLDLWARDVGLIGELKITTRLAPGVWERHAYQMGYDIQAAFYRQQAARLYPDLAGRIRVVNILISPDPPHVWRLAEADEATLGSADLEIARAEALFVRCMTDDAWPGYSELIEPYSIPQFALGARMAETEDA